MYKTIMDLDELTIEEKCENLMNIVVESRKRFGKLCIDYELKSALLENKMLNHRLEIISNFRFKPKQAISVVDYTEDIKQINDFAKQIENRQKKMKNIKEKIINTEKVVRQLKMDNISKKTRQPLTAEVMLARAKNKVENEAKVSKN